MQLVGDSKEASSGVLKIGVQVEYYAVRWRQQYTCFRGVQPESDGIKKTCNAPGSRLSGCTTTVNARLLNRTTKYGFPCIFLTVKTSIGTGMVVANIISQYENEDLLVEGLTILKEWNPCGYPNLP